MNDIIHKESRLLKKMQNLECFERFHHKTYILSACYLKHFLIKEKIKEEYVRLYELIISCIDSIRCNERIQLVIVTSNTSCYAIILLIKRQMITKKEKKIYNSRILRYGLKFLDLNYTPF